MSGEQNSCRLYLILDGEAPSRRLFSSLLSQAEIACALLRKGQEGRIDRPGAKQLLTVAHDHDVAFLIEDDVETAAAIGADGVHLNHPADRYPMARQALGADAIIGADCGLSRHAAMTLAENGADYVAFGAPSAFDPHAPEEARSEMIAWWSKLFEVPCVAFDVASLAEAQRVARQGADFVAVSDSYWHRADDVNEASERLLEAIRVMEEIC